MKLYHYFNRATSKSKQKSRWALCDGGETLLETGSSVAILRELRKRGLTVPEIMGGPSAFEQEYTIEWGAKKGGRMSEPVPTPDSVNAILAQVNACKRNYRDFPVNVADCRAEWHGDFFIIYHDKTPFDREHKAYCYMAAAWSILASGRPAGWKTTLILMTLRQALRECYAQGMGLTSPKAGCSKAELNEFLRRARARDVVHHGSNTF